MKSCFKFYSVVCIFVLAGMPRGKSSLLAHETDLPLQMQEQAACVIDLQVCNGKVCLELHLRPKDAQTALGASAKVVTARRLRQHVMGRLLINDKKALRIDSLPHGPKGEFRLRASFDLEVGTPFTLKAPLFAPGAGPTWLQVYDFLPGAQDPGERNDVLASVSEFKWPEARNPR